MLPLGSRGLTAQGVRLRGWCISKLVFVYMSYVHNIKYFLPLWPWRLLWKLEAQCLFEQGPSITRICLSAAQRKFCLADVFQLRMKRLLPAQAESFVSEGLRCCELLRDCFSGTPSVKIIRGSRFTQSAIAGPKSPPSAMGVVQSLQGKRFQVFSALERGGWGTR